MNIERIEHLLVMLREIHADQKKRKQFNLDQWADRTNDNGRNVCGTQCCSLGFAALTPWFQRRGLGLRNERNNGKIVKISNEEVLTEELNLYYSTSNFPIYPDIDVYYKDRKTGNSYYGFGAAEKFFDIDYDTSFVIFSPEYYHKNNKGVNRVINRVEYLLKNGEDKLHNKYIT